MKRFKAKVTNDGVFLAALENIKTVCGGQPDGFERENLVIFFTGGEENAEGVRWLTEVETVEEVKS